MTEQKPSFLAQIESYPAQFWVVNTMEIFERMSWYGWFTVMALYVTGSVATGGLGFSTETRGALQAIVPFFLYLLPVFTGALADRYGFKKSFIVAYLVMFCVPLVNVRALSVYDYGIYRQFWLIFETIAAVLVMAFPNSLLYYFPLSVKEDRFYNRCPCVNTKKITLQNKTMPSCRQSLLR